jgi:hypothetical protein
MHKPTRQPIETGYRVKAVFELMKPKSLLLFITLSFAKHDNMPGTLLGIDLDCSGYQILPPASN